MNNDSLLDAKTVVKAIYTNTKLLCIIFGIVYEAGTIAPVFAADSVDRTTSGIGLRSENNCRIEHRLLLASNASVSDNAKTNLDEAREELAVKQDSATKVESLEHDMKNLGKSLHHLKRSTWDVFCESQRQDLVVVAEPDVIGPIIVPALPTTTGVMSTGLLPPRRKWLDFFVSQIEDLLPMIEQDVSAIKLPPVPPADAIDSIALLKSEAAALSSDLGDLKVLISGDSLDNLQIASRAMKMQERVVSMDKARLKAYQALRREDEQVKKEVRLLQKQIKKFEH